MIKDTGGPAKADPLTPSEIVTRAWLVLQQELELQLKLETGASIHLTDAIQDLIRAMIAERSKP